MTCPIKVTCGGSGTVTPPAPVDVPAAPEVPSPESPKE